MPNSLTIKRGEIAEGKAPNGNRIKIQEIGYYATRYLLIVDGVHRNIEDIKKNQTIEIGDVYGDWIVMNEGLLNNQPSGTLRVFWEAP